ncbi:MAG TPA: hypothetical protein VEI97_02510, partial [bacterium]|nr:hypothetical protein [bacterium]
VSQMVALGADFSETELDDHFNWSDWQGRYIWALWVNRGPLLRLLNDHPRVERATVRFILPGRLEVTFQPKERYAAFISGGRAFWVAQDFTFCGLEPADRVAATRTMTGLSPGFLFAPDGTPLDDPFPEWPPLPGGSAVNQGRYYYHQLLRLWRWMDHETNPAESLVDHLELNKDRGIILHYRTGQNQPHPPILLGWGPELERKYGQALTVYRSGRWWGATGIEIDLSSNRNVVRTIHDPVPLDAADAGDSPTLAPADEARALGDPKGRSLSEFRVPMAPPFAPSAE